MIRGTTPTLEFTLPFSKEDVEALYITFCQCGRIVLEKTLSECAMEGEVLKVQLTQADTLAFSCRAVNIQIRVKMNDGAVLASEIITTNVDRILKDGEI